jgi:hypothetical protein
MIHLRRFEDKDDISDLLYKQKINKEISSYISEEVTFGNSKPFEIEHELYKSGDYICSSFKIDNRDVIVSSIIIDDTRMVNSGKHYNYLSDYISQFGIETDKYLFIGFGEYLGGKFYFDNNVNEYSTLFRKMGTIVEIIKTMISYHKVNHIILNSIENDDSSGVKRNYNKRDKFYSLYLFYHGIKNHKIKPEININGETISDFFLLEM